MSSDWDMPETYRPGARPSPEPVRPPANSSARGAGVIDPVAFFRFVIDNIVRIAAIAILLTSLSGCLTKRTVTEDGRTVSEGYAIKRPLKDAVENSN